MTVLLSFSVRIHKNRSLFICIGEVNEQVQIQFSNSLSSYQQSIFHEIFSIYLYLNDLIVLDLSIYFRLITYQFVGEFILIRCCQIFV